MSANLLSAQQVVALLDIDKSTVYRMATDGRLPAIKIGRQWRFPAAEIERLLHPGSAPEAATASATGATPAPDGSAIGTLSPPDAAPAASDAMHPTIDPDVALPIAELAAEALGVMMVVTDMYGRPVTGVVNPCPWFAAHAEDDGVVAGCVDEWRQLANDLDFEPRFQTGVHGFDCARAFVRCGSELVGMVLAGGIAPRGAAPDGLHSLDETERARVLAILPRVAAVLSRLAGHGTGMPTTAEPIRGSV